MGGEKRKKDAVKKRKKKKKKKKKKKRRREKKEKKKKKKKTKENDTQETSLARIDEKNDQEKVKGEVRFNEFYVPFDEVQTKTIAQQVFDKARQEKDKIRYSNLKSLSYSKKVQEFNEKLGKMGDHNSIPKISSASNG